MKPVNSSPVFVSTARVKSLVDMRRSGYAVKGLVYLFSKSLLGGFHGGHILFWSQEKKKSKKKRLKLSKQACL